MPKSIIEIIGEGLDFVVINKPAGISVTADRSGAEDLLTLLKRQLPNEGDLRLVHRLDKYTSGVMLIAKNREAQSLLSSHFEKRLIEKTYLALSIGAIPSRPRTINVPIIRSKRDARVMCVSRKKGKVAKTSFDVLADFGTICLLKVTPKTGRTHQIRLHLAHIGLPLAIDPLYGSSKPVMLSDYKDRYSRKKGQTEKPLIERLTLHAYQIELPATAFGPAVYTAKLDKKFAAAIKMLTKHNPDGGAAFRDKDDMARILAGEKL